VEAEHAVVADLQSRDPGLLAIARLEPGDRPAALAAGGAQVVERGVIAFGDIAALGRVDRRRGDQRPVEQVGQLAVAGQRRQQAASRDGGSAGRSAGREPPGLVEAVAKLAEIARAAASGDQPSQRPADVGQRLELAASLSRSPESPSNRATRSSRASIADRSSRGAPRSAASSRAPAPVTVRSTAWSRLPARPPVAAG
jgi:hypothetical protein